MGLALSKECRQLLKAASVGDAAHIYSCAASEPCLLQCQCSTALKRSTALHLAAAHGHAGMLPLLLHTLLQQARQEAATGVLQGPATTQLRRMVNARDLYDNHQLISQHHSQAGHHAAAARTPIIVAAKKGRLDCVRYLVEAGSNISAKDNTGNTCLHYAALFGHDAIVTHLLDHASRQGSLQRFVDQPNGSGYTALSFAVWGRHKDIVQQLLVSGANYTSCSERAGDNWVPAPVGSSALHLAVERSALDVLLVLLEHYAHLASSATPGETPPQDPRRIVNIYGLNASQLAQYLHRRALAWMTLPERPIMSLFASEQLDRWRTSGPAPLRAIAAAALEHALLDRLHKLQQQEQAGHEGSKEGKQHIVLRLQEEHERFDSHSCEPAMCNASANAELPTSRMTRQPSSSSSSSGGGSCCAGGTSLHAGCQEVRHAVTQPSQPGVSRQVWFGAGQPAVGSSTQRKGSPASLVGMASGNADATCCVCLEEGFMLEVEGCGHKVCLNCALQLSKVHRYQPPTCPLCRRPIAGFHGAQQAAAAAASATAERGA